MIKLDQEAGYHILQLSLDKVSLPQVIGPSGSALPPDVTVSANSLSTFVQAIPNPESCLLLSVQA